MRPFAKCHKLLQGSWLAVWMTGLVWIVVHAAPSAVQMATPQAADKPARDHAYKLDAGRFAVDEAKEIILVDRKRGKELSVRALYPIGPGPFPVIIFSHGAGSSKDCCSDLVRHWASHGYLTLQPAHADAVQSQRQPTSLRPGGPGRQDWMSNASAWENRARDVSFVIDSLAEIESLVPALDKKLDSKRIGVSGHSLGAYTALLIGGATVDTPASKGASFADLRVRAILVLSGQGRGQQGLTENSWGQLGRPMMAMTGSRDRGASGQDPDWRKEPFDLSPPGDKYHVWIEGAGNFSFTGKSAAATLPALRAQRPAGQAAEAKPSEIFGYVQIATTAFWDAYLKTDAKARTYLRSDGLEAYSQGAVKLDRR